ncbi:peptidyl-prolyl cis-trans isomerase SlyD, FKBP-type [gut metagenome]|uniref:peptidylprolyl isomerase n=1 Tax=gut metagenome TaxID=749906 RepID=J9GGJ4_9ZZZZ
MAYKLYTVEDGERDFTEEAPATHPFQFISGLGMTLEAFENQLNNLNQGDTFDFTLTPEEAYGEYNEEHVIDLPKEIFMIDGKFDNEHVVEGAVLPLMTNDGQRINGSVVEVKEDVVVMDMNHPLAGCSLNFVGEVITSRAATNEEISEAVQMMSSDCGGSCGGCGGGCGNGECGDGCGCEGGCCH